VQNANVVLALVGSHPSLLSHKNVELIKLLFAVSLLEELWNHFHLTDRRTWHVNCTAAALGMDFFVHFK